MSREPVGAHCPGCGEHAALILPGQHQAMCGNDDCTVLLWDMDMSLTELMDDAHVIDLRDGWTDWGEGDPGMH